MKSTFVSKWEWRQAVFVEFSSIVDSRWNVPIDRAIECVHCAIGCSIYGFFEVPFVVAANRIKWAILIAICKTKSFRFVVIMLFVTKHFQIFTFVLNIIESWVQFKWCFRNRNIQRIKKTYIRENTVQRLYRTPISKPLLNSIKLIWKQVFFFNF
jgi:hypothetical protein